jgi:hypothetical protein
VSTAGLALPRAATAIGPMVWARGWRKRHAAARG